MSSANLTACHERLHRDILTAHRALKRGLRSIVDTAPLVLPADENAFRLYCSAFNTFLHATNHHKVDIVFPSLACACGMQDNLKQLEPNQADLLQLMSTFEESLKAAAAWDGKAVARSAHALQLKLIDHLRAEEAILTLITLSRAPSDLVQAVRHQIKAEAKRFDRATVLPFLVKNLTAEEAEYLVFDGTPWLFRKVVYPMLCRRNKRSWAFASKPTAATALARSCSVQGLLRDKQLQDYQHDSISAAFAFYC